MEEDYATMTENDRKNKRKLRQGTISIDLTSFFPSPKKLSDGNSYCLRPKMRPMKCGTEVTTVFNSPPTTPIKLSHNDEKSDSNHEKPTKVQAKFRTKVQAKFRPKVMDNSPITKSTPKPITPSPSSGGRRVGSSVKSSCRRRLDFASGNIQTKTLQVRTKGGFCFTRKVTTYISGHQQKIKGLALQCNEKAEDKWWKNEQELFRQRAFSFIRSMRLVQGNRSFMGWKGSVVDSVVGVFLTQNTADNHSSSAFMSLAAKYPKENIIGDSENDNLTDHSLDWNAVRCAQLDEISHAIEERGMYNRIAARIQMFLDSILDEKSGLLDLEWLRKAKPVKAMEFFLKIYGLGLKSMECLRLLTLRQCAFPVDRHVTRIVVRLGWVPIEKLPDGVLIHQLKEYPAMNIVQEYLSQRLCNLNVEALYELHYQMITFGKVFCTKKKPNCNSCPLKKECKHYASAFPSSRFPLSGPPVEYAFAPVTPGERTGVEYEPVSSIPPCPEQNIKARFEKDIEDICLGPEVHPVIIETKELRENVWDYMGEKNIPLKKYSVSEALITPSAEEAFIPAHKPKNAGRLRTEHQVYELPDSHSLLQVLDKRDCDDKNPYLLAIWPQETQNPSRVISEGCNSLESIVPDNADSQEEMVRGTFLVPCRTATRGSFPLDGTFFQINEVFADDESSEKPRLVPRKLLWGLTRKTLYCGTSISTIFRGLSTRTIQECFWEGYVCIRGFNMKTRAPRPLPELFHSARSKTVKIKAKGKSPRNQTSI